MTLNALGAPALGVEVRGDGTPGSERGARGRPGLKRRTYLRRCVVLDIFRRPAGLLAACALVLGILSASPARAQAEVTLVLNVDAIAGDGTVNIAEKASGFAIAGDTGPEAGAGVTVQVGGTPLSATSADNNGTATWSVSVPAGASYIVGSAVTVTVSASKDGFTAPADVPRTLEVDLVAPSAPAYTPPGSLTVGGTIASMSPSGGSDIAGYRAAGLPSGLVIDAATGAIGGTPDTAGGAATATVTVSDPAGNTADVSIAFPAVGKGQQVLSGFAYSPASVTFGSSLTAPSVTAPGGAITTLGYTATPAAVCTVNPVSGALTIVGAGTCVVTATAAGTANYDPGSASFTVTAINAALLTAVFQNAPASHDGSSPFSVELRFSERVDLSFTAFGNGLLTIAGGTLVDQERLVRGDSSAWRIDVRPDSHEDVIVTLPANGACIQSVAPCTPDGRRLSAAASVRVAGPVAPRITGQAAFIVEENRSAVATLTAIDEDTPAADLDWSIPPGAEGGEDGGKFRFNSTGVLAFASAKNFENPDDADGDGIYRVTIEVSDGAFTDTADLTVTLSDVNEAPTADAGGNQRDIEQGTTVTLSGSGSDPDAGDTLSYAWTQTEGEDVALTDADAATATFTAPILDHFTFLRFRLRVTDGAGLSGEDTVRVIVVAASTPEPPVITEPTSFTAEENQTAVGTLTATDADTPAADLAWSIFGGADFTDFTLSATGVLAFASAKDFENPDDADADGIYEVAVQVTDGTQPYSTTVTVTLSSVNEAPTADAGADRPHVGEGAIVTLSGSGSSDPDAGDTLSYAWTQTAGEDVTLTGADAAAAAFTAPSGLSADAVLTFSLRVTDEGGLSHQDTVRVTVIEAVALTAVFQDAPARHDRSTPFQRDTSLQRERLSELRRVQQRVIDDRRRPACGPEPAGGGRQHRLADRRESQWRRRRDRHAAGERDLRPGYRALYGRWAAAVRRGQRHGGQSDCAADHRTGGLYRRGEHRGSGDADSDRCRHAARRSHLVDSLGHRGRG